MNDTSQLRALARSIAEREVAPRAADHDRNSSYPHEVFAAFAGAGLLGISLPERFGGGGAGITALCTAIEEVARQCNSAALMLLLSQLAGGPIVLSGNEELCQEYLPPLANGHRRGSFCLTEPQAGSDVASIRTRATKSGAFYRVTGRKAYISGGPLADFFVVWCKVEGEGDGGPSDRKGLAGFVVERSWEGVSIGHVDSKMGVRAVPTSEVAFDDVEVPESHRLTAPGTGFQSLMKCLNTARPGVAARGLGLAQGALAYSTGYAQSREAFGKRLVDLPAIQFLMADLALGIESVRGLVYRAAALIDGGDAGRDAAPYIAMAKCAAGDLAVKAASDSMQILGGAGYMADHQLERFYRDAKQLQIVEGTAQIQRLIIGRAIRDGVLKI